MIALVAAMDEARLIGVGGRLPWHSPADMAHFRALTMGHAVVMGWWTWIGLPSPLEGRVVTVCTRSGMSPRPGVTWAPSLAALLRQRRTLTDDTIVAGGASIYAQTLPMADRLYLTRIRHTFPAGDGAVYFPEWDGFRLVGSKHREADAANPWPMDFETWERA